MMTLALVLAGLALGTSLFAVVQQRSMMVMQAQQIKTLRQQQAAENTQIRRLNAQAGVRSPAARRRTGGWPGAGPGAGLGGAASFLGAVRSTISACAPVPGQRRLLTSFDGDQRRCR
jgi:hypothetical protein